MPILFVFLAVALLLGWLVSEFRSPRWLRIILGTCAFLSSFGVAAFVGSLEHFNANAWYGHASKELVDTTVAELEKGKTKQVLTELKQLQKQFTPTYENRARYDQLVEEYVRRVTRAERDGENGHRP
jgi:hypothetical protein